MSRLRQLAACIVLAATACHDGSSTEPPPPWTYLLGNSESDRAYAVATDRSGNVIVAGYIDGMFHDQSSLFVWKLDPAGTTLWTRVLGAGEQTVTLAYAVAADPDGNVLVAGGTTGGLDGNSPLGEGDAFVSKLDPDGAILWTRQFGTAWRDVAYGVATDASGDVYVAGAAFLALQLSGGKDGFLVKLDANGAEVWSVPIVTLNDDEARGVVVDPEGSVYVAGSTGGNMFLAKYDAGGQRAWFEQRGGTGTVLAYSMAADDSGNLLVAGTTYGAFDGNPYSGGTDGFVASYDGGGTLRWSAQFGTAADDFGIAVATHGGSAFVVGSTSGRIDGNGTPCAGHSDAFILKFDGDGAKTWSRQFGSPGSDNAYGAATDSSGNVFVAGSTDGALDGVPPAGSGDAFVTSYDAMGNKR